MEEWKREGHRVGLVGPCLILWPAWSIVTSHEEHGRRGAPQPHTCFWNCSLSRLLLVVSGKFIHSSERLKLNFNEFPDCNMQLLAVCAMSLRNLPPRYVATLRKRGPINPEDQAGCLVASTASQ